MGKKILIVGGVAGGASAAARLRRLDETAEIIMFERDEHISFANCGLPYYIGEVITDREDLLIQTPESMKARFNIDVRINSEVIALDGNRKIVKISSRDRGIYEESYDFIVLSPGAKAIRPNIEGISNDRIFTLRNIKDTDRIKEYTDKKDITKVTVIGGGYVGVEMAENLALRGLHVTLVEAAPHILAPFDSDISVLLEAELRKHGIELILNDGVKAFKDHDNSLNIILNSEKVITTDMVILAIGVAPDTSFLKDSGIRLGTRGHILVSDRMETNLPGVYAVGDAIEVVDFVNSQNTAIPLAGPANKQGRIAADNIIGLTSTYKGTLGTSIIKVFNLIAASTGNNERTLKKLNLPHKAIFVHPVSHASYYPGAKQITLKLLFDDKGVILGAQAVGAEGVDKRIDVIATAIRLHGTIYDLSELELCYAPPFSSAKDPVNMAGFVAENVIAGRMEVITPDQYLETDNRDALLLDVRTKPEFDKGHIEGALNIPVDNLRERINELDKSKEIIEYCQVGLRGYIAARILNQNGFKVKNMTGGFKSASTLNFKLNKAPELKEVEVNPTPDTQLQKKD